MFENISNKPLMPSKSPNKLMFGRIKNIIESRDFSSNGRKISPKIKYKLCDIKVALGERRTLQ